MHLNQKSMDIDVKEEILAYSDSDHCVDTQGSSEVRKVKVEDVDIVEQFIDEDGVYDRKEIRSETGTNDLFEQFEGKGAHSEFKISTHRQELSDTIMFEYNSEQVIAADSIVKKESGEHTDDKYKKHKCNLCDYATIRKNDLKRHTNSVHLNLKENKCHLCEYATSTKDYLKKHMVSVHFNLRQAQCHLCDYAANARKHLKQHIDSVHLNSRKYKCNLCDYAANQMSGLRSHMDSVHLNLKQHKCQSCNYASNTKNTLNQHVHSIHSNSKKHKCNFCGYVTNRTSQLKIHTNSFHSDLKQHTCHLSTNHINSFKRHMDCVQLSSKNHK